jgi:hypothetical protein
VAGFVTSLDRIGLVATVDGRPARAHVEPARSGLSLPRLRAAHVRWLCTRPVAVGWLAVVGTALAALAFRREARPGLHDLVWANSAALVLLVDYVVAAVVIFLHEFGHLAAARAYGVPGTMTLSTRFTVLVAQTDVTGAWALPRRRRVVVYLAGTAVDLFLAALCTLATVPLPPSGTLAKALHATVISLTIAVLLQCALFLRTDAYFLIQDLAGCRNLHGDAKRLLRWWAARLVGPAGQRDPRAALAPRERRAVTLYAPFMALGGGLTVAVFVVISVPVFVRMLTLSVGAVGHGIHEHSTGQLANGIVSLAVLAVFNGTLFLLLGRKATRALRRAVPVGDARWTYRR